MNLRLLALLSLLAAGCTASGTVSGASPSPSAPTSNPGVVASTSPNATAVSAPTPAPTASPITADGAVTLPSGLKYTILTPAPAGAARVALGQKLTVNYTGWLLDGTKFDSSLNPGRTPFSFTLGSGVIQGWNIGVNGMAVGEKRKLVIPPDLGYGASGQGQIPPNATLVFEVTLLSINP